MTEIKACPICGNTKFSNIHECVDYTVTRQIFQLQECSSCGFLLTSPRPDEKNISAYYQSDNYISHSSAATTLVDKLYLTARNFTLKWKLKIVEQYTNESGNKSLLDFGCGTGNFLHAAFNKQWHTYGVEPSDSARTLATTLTPALKVFNSIDVVQDQVDAITLWHVLEHVPDLDATLQKLKQRLSNAGTLFIAVPNHNAADAQYYKHHWAGYDVPRHLWHFSQSNMKTLLLKNDLKLINIIPMKLDSYYISLLSEKYKGNNQMGVGTMIKGFTHGFTSNLKARTTGEYSSLIYIATK